MLVLDDCCATIASVVDREFDVLPRNRHEMFAAELHATDGAEVIERDPEFGSNAQRAEVHDRASRRTPASRVDLRTRGKAKGLGGESDETIATSHD